MKIGTLTDSYKIQKGFATSQINKETVKFHTMIDGTLDRTDYGSRNEQVATFKVVFLSKTQFVELGEYLIENTGRAVLIEQENTSESLFTENWSPIDDDYYVKILGVSGYKEADFSITRELFELQVSVGLLGETSTSKLNLADSSIYEILIDIDTTQGATIGGTEPGSPSIDDRWLDTAGNEGDANNLYECIDPSGATFADRWDTLYQVASNDSDIGWEDGWFHYSSFADVTADIPNSVLYDYKSGIINYKSVNVAGISINLRNGPTVARKNGFSFSIDDTMDTPDGSSPFWEFIVSEGIVLYNAICSISFYRSSPSKVVRKDFTGKNVNNSFSYTDYIFQVDPIGLDYKQVYPVGEIKEDDSRGIYTDIKPGFEGQTPFATFGQFKYAALQNVSIEDQLIEFTANEPDQQVAIIAGQIDYTVVANTRIVISNDSSDGYTISSDLLALLDNGEYALRIRTDDASDNEDEVRKIESVDDTEPSGYTGFYIIDVKEGFPTRPTPNADPNPPQTDDIIEFEILHSSLRHQIDEDECLGFGSLIDDEFKNSIDVFRISDEGTDLVQVPKTSFVENADKNRLVLLPQSRGNSTTITTFKEIASDENNPIDVLSQYFIQPLNFTGSPRNVDLNLPNWAGAVSEGFEQNHYAMISTDFTADVHYYCSFAGMYNLAGADRTTSKIGNDKNIFKEFDGTVNDSIKAGAYIGLRNRYNDFTLDSEGFMCHVYHFPVSHAGFQDDILNNSEQVLLAIDATIKSLFSFKYRPDWDDPFRLRTQGQGFKIKFRFHKTNGLYYENDTDWIIEVTQNQLSLGIRTSDAEKLSQGTININNFPDGDEDGGFKVESTTLLDNYDYWVSYKRNDFVDLSGISSSELVIGDRALVNNSMKIYELTSLSPATWTFERDVVNDDVIAVYKSTKNGSLDWDNIIVIDDTESFNFRFADSGTDYNLTPTLQGRNLLDVTELFPSEWALVDYMEMIIYNEDYTTYQTIVDGDTSKSQEEWEIDWNLNRPIALMAVEQFDLADKQLFATCKGKNLTDFDSPEYISKKIMDNLYTGIYDESSLNAVTQSGARSMWKWRKQFIGAKDNNKIINDLLWNLWAAAYYDEDDKLVFQSLIPTDNNLFNPSRVFTDSDIIADSFSRPRMRKAGEIYQDFRLNFDLSMPSLFSSKIQKYRTHVINRNNANAEQLSYITQSRRLFDNEKVFEKNLDYHYDGTAIPYATELVRFFSFNAWDLSFVIPMKNTLDSEQITPLQTIGLNSYFHTKSTQVNGYVVGMIPNYYDGLMKITMFIPEPPGYSLCDVFKDALFIPERGVNSVWTEVNDLANDAGSIPRTVIDLSDDAGLIPGRNLNSC